MNVDHRGLGVDGVSRFGRRPDVDLAGDLLVLGAPLASAPSFAPAPSPAPVPAPVSVVAVSAAATAILSAGLAKNAAAILTSVGSTEAK